MNNSQRIIIDNVTNILSCHDTKLRSSFHSSRSLRHFNICELAASPSASSKALTHLGANVE